MRRCTTVGRAWYEGETREARAIFSRREGEAIVSAVAEIYDSAQLDKRARPIGKTTWPIVLPVDSSH